LGDELGDKRAPKLLEVSSKALDLLMGQKGRHMASTKHAVFIDAATLKIALARMYGTPGHLLKIWLTLKHMGFPLPAPAEQTQCAEAGGEEREGGRPARLVLFQNPTRIVGAPRVCTTNLF
jgi:hypothetical protein